MALSVHEIASYCGMSAMTVSRALDPARAHLVRESTRAKIQSFCAARKFQPNFQARSLASGHTGIIGMIMPWISTVGTSPAFGDFLALVTAELESRGFTLALLPVPNSDRETIFAEVLKTFRARKADGFLSLADFVDPRAEEKLAREKIPLSTFAMPADAVQSAGSDIPNVRIDESRGCDEVYAHLAERGDVAVLGVKPAAGRHARYEKLLELARGAMFDIPRGRFFNYDNAADAMAGIRLHWDKLRHYRAWLCQNDRIAYGASLELASRGIAPGRDVALAGFDDTENGRGDAFFTTVRPPYGVMARVCADNLRALLSGHTPSPLETVLYPDLVRRASTLDFAPKRQNQANRKENTQ